MGLFDKFKKNSKNVKRESEIINVSGWDAIDEKQKEYIQVRIIQNIMHL